MCNLINNDIICAFPLNVPQTSSIACQMKIRPFCRVSVWNKSVIALSNKTQRKTSSQRKSSGHKPTPPHPLHFFFFHLPLNLHAFQMKKKPQLASGHRNIHNYLGYPKTRGVWWYSNRLSTFYGPPKSVQINHNHSICPISATLIAP